jgi:anti-sigma B factor antagonist
MKAPQPRSTDMRLDLFDGYPRLVLRGECNTGLAARLKERLDQLLQGGCRGIMLDTRDMRYLDQSCYLALTSAIERLRASGGECVIVDGSDSLERSLKLLNLGASVVAVPTLSQASSYLSWSH